MTGVEPVQWNSRQVGSRYQAFVTNTATGQLQFLSGQATGSRPGRGPNPPRKDKGLGRLPSRDFALNHAWLVSVMIAADLVAWTRVLACTGDAAVPAMCEPQALLYRSLPSTLQHS